MKQAAMLIDGEWVSSNERIDSYNPATGEPWAQIPAGTAADVDRAVRAAQRAMTAGPWASMTATERGSAIGRLAALVRENSGHLAEMETRDTGKLIRETIGSSGYVPAFYDYFAGLADKVSGKTLPIDKPDMHVYTMREPVGVVAAIVPWNSPQMLLAVKLAPALAAGNAVVIKPSEHASIPVLEFARLAEQAGLPAGVVNVVTGTGERVGESLTTHPLVRRIAFTGGPDTARSIVRNSAENFAHVSLELGGKSPQIVFPDANIESAVNGSIAGIFGATGQSCVAGSRLYLHHDIADEFLARMVGLTKSIQIGDPLHDDTQMGPLCTLGQMARVEAEVAKAQLQGGTVLCGGKRPDGLIGNYYEPTIIECPRQDLDIVDTEMFGPVLSVLRFKTEAEVIALANDTVHGLAAGVFTQDSARSLRVARAIEAGIVWVNTYRVVSPIAEFGGNKGSGYGRESGFQAMYDYTRPKTIWMNTSSEPMSNPFVMR